MKHGQLRIIGVGLPKTGTTTLYRALAESGVRTAHQIPGYKMPTVGNCIDKALEEGLPVDTYLHYLEAVTQLDNVGDNHPPAWPHLRWEFWDALYHRNMQIILHTREPRDTIHSMRNWKEGWMERFLTRTPGLHAEATDAEIEKWILDYYAMVRARAKRLYEFPVEEPDLETLSDIAGAKVKWWGRENASVDQSTD